MVSLPVGCIPVPSPRSSDAQTQHPRHNRQSSRSDLDTYLDDATSFIYPPTFAGAASLVHCGAGKSRSVAVVIAYLCRYAGAGFVEAAAFVAGMGQGPARRRASPMRSSGGCGSMSWRRRGLDDELRQRRRNT